MEKYPVLFAIGSEEVILINDTLYVNGANYQFRVILLYNDFMTTGKVKYKETKQFLRDYLIRTGEIK